MNDPIAEARALLEANGFVILKAKSYRQAQERQRVAEALLRAAEERTEDSRKWARDCRADERKLGERCTYLYGLAARHGATDAELHPWTAASVDGPVTP